VNHRRAIVGLFVISMLVAGTAAYDVARSDRPAEVTVADDGEAYLAFDDDVDDEPIENGTVGAAFEVTNSLGQSVELSATVMSSDSVSFEKLNASGETGDEVDLATDETASVEVRCDDSATTDTFDLTVEFVAEGDGLSVEATRTIEVRCTSS
jgi:hypothetical protein